MTPKSQDARWSEGPTGRFLASHVHRPKALLAAEVYLVVLALAVGRLILGALLIPGFLASPDNVPPLVVEAGLSVPLAVAALGLPICLVPLAIAGTRLPGRVPWSWTHLAAAWLIIAFAEMPLAAGLTAAVLFLGAIPAALVGSSLESLRRAAGQPWETKWTRRRTVVITAVALAVAAFWAVYLISGVLGMHLPSVRGLYYGPFAH